MYECDYFTKLITMSFQIVFTKDNTNLGITKQVGYIVCCMMWCELRWCEVRWGEVRKKNGANKDLKGDLVLLLLVLCTSRDRRVDKTYQEKVSNEVSFEHMVKQQWCGCTYTPLHVSYIVIANQKGLSLHVMNRIKLHHVFAIDVTVKYSKCVCLRVILNLKIVFHYFVYFCLNCLIHA